MIKPQDLPNDQVFKTVPYQHQVEGLLLSRSKTIYALLCEMGVGKSKILVDTVTWLFSQGKINGLLVVAPKSICRNWTEKEIPQHLPDSIERRCVLWGGNTKAFERELKTLFEAEPLKLHVLVINVEALATDRGYDAVESFLMGHDALMVIDESTTIKNHSAKRTKCAVKLGKLARYRRVMTGTPVTQSPLDVYGQFEFLEHGCLGSYTYYGFRNHYAVLRKRYVNGRAFDEIVGYQRLEELQRTIGELSYRVLKADCLDLPDKVYEVRHVELTPAQKKYYEELRDEAMTMLSDGTVITAALALTCLLRLRQALCNIAPLANVLEPTSPGPPTCWISDSNPRAEEVLNILEEAGEQKVIIWANFIPTIRLLRELIEKRFGPEAVGAIHGSVKPAERQEVVTAFQDPTGPLRFIVAQPRTGGYGLTLTAATLVIYHDNDWSLEVRQQSEDRAHRIGQEQKVTYIDLVAVDTVDEKIRAALVQKRDLAERVTGDSLREMLA